MEENDINNKLCFSCQDFIGQFYYADYGLLCIHCEQRREIHNLCTRMTGVLDHADSVLDETRRSIKKITDESAEPIDLATYELTPKPRMTKKKIKQTLDEITDPELKQYAEDLLKT